MSSTVPQRNPATDLALGVVRLLVAAAIVFAVEGVFEANRLLAFAVGALAVDLLGGRAGVKWDETGSRPYKAQAMMMLRGVGGGAVAVILVVSVLAALGKATIGAGHPASVSLLMGAAVALVQAARDELLFRGMPLALMRGRVADRWALPFVSLLAAAPVILAANTTAVGVSLVLVSSFVFALLWRLGRGIHLAWGAHAAWLFLAGSGVRGGLADVRLVEGQVLPLFSAFGSPGWIALGVGGVAAGVSLWRVRRAA